MKKKIILIATCISLLVLLSAVLVGCGAEEAQTLYYNLDGAIYQNPSNTALSNRQPDADGIYRIDFASGGQTVTYTTTDATLVNLVDFLQVMTLEVSEKGEIRQAFIPGNPISNQDTIQQIRTSELVVNSSFAYNGKETTLPLAENCRFYDLSNSGAETQPEIMDEILAYGNSKGEATDVFILRRLPQSKLYWRLNRYYDSRTDSTTREPDASGVYTIPFSVEGEHVELKCKDWEVVSAIDAPSATNAAMGLVLDDEGYITKMLPGYRALRGREICNMYDVIAIDGDRVTVQNKQIASVYGRVCHTTLGEACRIYDMSSGAELTGQPTDHLQVGDRITVFSDPMGIATNILIHVRLLDSPVYFNLFQLYSGSQTSRFPDGEGFYSFQMVCEGQSLTLKTKDKAIANKIDSYSSRAMGLIRDGDVILRVFDVSCVTGDDALMIGRYVFSYTASMIVSTNARGGSMKALMLHKDCKIYDVSATAAAMGGETTLRKGDCFNAVGTADGQATHIFITHRGS